MFIFDSKIKININFIKPYNFVDLKLTHTTEKL